MDIFVDDQNDGYHPNQLMRDGSIRNRALQHLFSYGRPYWGAILRTGNLAMVQRMARTKIYGKENKGFERLNDVEAIALIPHRINFHVALYDLAETLSSSYLRYITGISEDHTLLSTTQPSEPILAFISAQDMLEDPGRRLRAVEALYDNVSKGFIHLGDIGEAIAALILMFTFDRVHGLRYPTPVKFSKFIETLLPHSAVLEIESRMGDSENMQALGDHGFVFFNHFVRLSERPTEKTIRMAYGRGAAIFAPPRFKGCDIIIPIHVQGQDKMSYFIVQVKNRSDDTLSKSLRNEARESLKSAADILPRPPSHMAMLMSLRSKDGQRDIGVVYPEPDSEEKTEVERRQLRSPVQLDQ
ncbi:hypothetical protein VTN96DRAFT_9642 [Rasamsonia emersonii]|uniref:Uncharacterized protein n=1 Tax=Rasamsonia emersonii (strain ATCC 16479 / CBS 393.64 / IMI 116815) TaxID=1408163 RepID=A0A0F4YYN9_RASE3|nr:hypothetical protein T310_2613 [Rasamsonia emersonii CBS 393.64]KKA23359.1 hypothetical protein T310_2613 [Rasamsonia emersonii CBS 393.64]